jgi:hypothetical protein
LSAQVLTNGVFSLSFSGTVSNGYTVHASTNVALTPLSEWTTLGSGTFQAGITTFNDLTSTNFPYRFYLISSP